MKYAAWSLVVLSLLTVLGISGVGSPDAESGPLVLAAESKAPPLPPLKIDMDAPLLLDSSPEPKPKRTKAKTADNSACYVCHTNYDGESLAAAHAKADIGCVKCHGESVAHRNDEDNITPPDVMFAADQIEKACAECHETHDAPARKVIATWQQRCPAKENPDALVCTDCHGEHRMAFRTVWWDKKTRKLADRKGQRVKYAPDLTKKPAKPEKPQTKSPQ